MKKEAASRTAQYMALFRAMETARPFEERLFTDPDAISFLDGGLKFGTKLSSFSPVRKVLERYIHSRVPGAYTSGIARTKYIDDLLKRSIDNGVQRVIILGAGFDTRALRLDFMKGIQVIEIDHPNTARLKMDTLKATNGSLPVHVKYYQIDFNVQSLDSLAEEHGLDFSIPTTIIWEGVTNYLNADAINSTFRFIERFVKGSHVIFTYVDQLILDDPKAFYGGEKLLHDVDAIEERWTYGMHPADVVKFLKNFQLTLLEDLGAADYRKRYIPQRPEQGYEFYRVVMAIRD
ncbi:MAG: methyltransferase [Bacteroidetes bacterium]|nr:methyltransferase [Bacteroidota bacterium]